MNTIEQLGNEISRELGSGTDLLELKPLLEKYSGTDWKGIATFKDCYTRTQVYVDDNIEILILGWNKNQRSGIHNHPDNGCLVKLLCGRLREDVYEGEKDDVYMTESHYLDVGGISYRKGKTGWHVIANDSDKCATSLHVYAPPGYRPEVTQAKSTDSD